MHHRAHRCVQAVIAFGSFAALVGPLAGSASALILNGGPSIRPNISFVGLFNGGTAVAVGPREILTAAHVGGGRGSSFWLGGSSFRAVSTITSDTADLMRVTLDRDLPGYYPIADSSLKRGARLTVAGFGLTAESSTRSGFTWSDDRAEVWGTNRLDAARDGHLFFRFDRRGGASEAILTPGDSGGAVFITGPDGNLALAGINRGVYQRLGGRASFGDTSVAVDLTSIGGFLGGLAVVPAPGATGVMVLAGLVALRRRR
ncbi:MAG: trypsin-like peptidase domain-containing protein [Phycisphaerales bacterium]